MDLKGGGGFDRAKLDMIRIPFRFHAYALPVTDMC